MLMLLLMVVAVAAVMLMLLLMVVAVAAVMLMLHLLQLLGNGGLALHGLQELLAGQFIPGGGDQSCRVIMGTQKCHSRIQLSLRNGIGPGQDDGGSGLNLVIVELTEVLHIHLDLAGVRHSHLIAQRHILGGDLLGSSHHVGQLAHAGGFDDNPVGVEFLNDFFQSLAEIAHQTAADAAGVHLRDVDAGIL